MFGYGVCFLVGNLIPNHRYLLYFNQLAFIGVFIYSTTSSIM